MLQIRLRRDPSSESAGGVRPVPTETVTVACPDHLVLADLPVAKGIGSVTAASVVKTVGRRSRRQLGERVHFCVRCDYPIAVYGRLSPCEHAFCLECARSDSICYLCDERIQKIQTIKMMEGIFICAAPHCLKSFLKKTEFEFHIHESHTELLQPIAEKDDCKESDAQSVMQSSASDSNLRAPPRPLFSPGSNSQPHDHEDKARWQQSRDQLPPRPIMQLKTPPPFGQVPSYPTDSQTDNNRPPGFDRPGPHNGFQQNFDTQSTPQQESSQFPDKLQGNSSQNQHPEYPPMQSVQPPNFIMPMNQNPALPQPFGIPPFPPEGGQLYYGAPYEITRQDSAPETGAEQGSLLGFPPGPVGGANFSTPYPQTWNSGPSGIPFDAKIGGQGVQEGFINSSDSQGKVPFYQGGEYGRNPIDPRDGKGILASQPMQAPSLPPPPPPHLRGQFYSGDMSRDGQGFGWQHENRDNFGGNHD